MPKKVTPDLTEDQYLAQLTERFLDCAQMTTDLQKMGFYEVFTVVHNHGIKDSPLVYISIPVNEGISHDRLVELVDYGEQNKVQITNFLPGGKLEFRLWPKRDVPSPPPPEST